MNIRKIAIYAATLALSWAIAGPVAAATAETPAQSYAVLSLIGDKMTVVWFHQSTASNLDRNERQEVPTQDTTFDNTALLAVNDAVKRVAPHASTVLLASRDPALYKLQSQIPDEATEATPSMSALAALAQRSKATRLILITKHKSEARLQFKDSRLGTGWLSGLGFFVDQERVTADSVSGIEDVGFIAPYAYLAVSLIDTSTMKTLRRSIIRESTVVASARSRNVVRPWDALTPKQKLDALEAAIRKGVDQAVPELLAGG